MISDLQPEQSDRSDRSPRLSIVIPCFNGRDYLVECLRSLGSLTTIPWEAVVVDDGSTEEIQSVVTDASPRVRYVRQANQGPAAARNTGIGRTVGEYIWFLDSDDRLISPDGLARQVQVLDTHPEVGLVHAKALVVDHEGRPLRIRKPRFARGDYVRSGEAELSDLLFGNYITTSCTIVRRTMTQEVGGFSTDLFGPEDWDYWLRIACVASVAYVNESVVAYRTHGNSITSRYTPDRWLQTHVNILDRIFSKPEVVRWYARLRPSIEATMYLATATIAYGERQMPAARSHAWTAMRQSIDCRNFGQAGSGLGIIVKSYLPDSARRLARHARRSCQSAFAARQLPAGYPKLRGNV